MRLTVVDMDAHSGPTTLPRSKLTLNSGIIVDRAERGSTFLKMGTAAACVLLRSISHVRTCRWLFVELTPPTHRQSVTQSLTQRDISQSVSRSSVPTDRPTEVRQPSDVELGMVDGGRGQWASQCTNYKTHNRNTADGWPSSCVLAG